MKFESGKMPRIAVVGHAVSALPGGLVNYQRQLVAHLQQQTSPCEVVSFWVDQTGGFSNQFSKVDNAETEHWIRIHPRRLKVLNRICMSLAARSLIHGLLERFTIFLSYGDWKGLCELQPTVIHYIGTGRTWLGFPLRRLAGKLGARFTIWPAIHPGTWGDDVIDLRLYRQADAVFTQSDHERDYLIARGVPACLIQRCGLAPMCLPEGSSARLRETLGLGSRPVVLFLGRRDEGKGYPALLRAWPLVLKRQPEAVLLLAGPGGAEFSLLRQALPATSVRDLGVPDELGKADAYAACDVFCLPSAQESFGIAYVEAWSYQKPVICGTAPACRELIQDGVTGLWSDQQPVQLAENIIHLLTRPAQANRMGEQGYAMQQREYTWQAVTARHLAAFAADTV